MPKYSVVTKKIVINAMTAKLLELWEDVLKRNGIDLKSHPQLMPGEASNRKDLDLISEGIKNLKEFFTKKPQGLLEREFVGFDFPVEVDCKELLDWYQTHLDTVLDKDGVTFKKLDNVQVKSHFVVIHEILLRIVAQSLCKSNISDPKNDGNNHYLNAFKDFCVELLQHKNLVYEKGWFTEEPIFKDAVTALADHLGRLGEWVPYFQAALRVSSIINKASHTAEQCGSYFDMAIAKLKQHVCIELTKKIKDGELAEKHINAKYEKVCAKVIAKFDEKKKSTELHEDLFAILALSRDIKHDQAKILAYLDFSIRHPGLLGKLKNNGKKSSRLVNEPERVSNLKRLFLFLNKTEQMQKIFKSFANIISVTGWTAILLGVFNLEGFKKIIVDHQAESVEILKINRPLSGDIGKAILSALVTNRLPLNDLAFSACGYINALNNPGIQNKVIEILQKSISFLQAQELQFGIHNIKLINVEHLPKDIKQKLGLNKPVASTSANVSHQLSEKYTIASVEGGPVASQTQLPPAPPSGDEAAEKTRVSQGSQVDGEAESHSTSPGQTSIKTNSPAQERKPGIPKLSIPPRLAGERREKNPYVPTAAVVGKSIQEIKRLAKLKEVNVEVIENYDVPDSFFYSLAVALSIVKPNTKYTAQALRKICADFYLDTQERNTKKLKKKSKKSVNTQSEANPPTLNGIEKWYDKYASQKCPDNYADIVLTPAEAIHASKPVIKGHPLVEGRVICLKKVCKKINVITCDASVAEHSISCVEHDGFKKSTQIKYDFDDDSIYIINYKNVFYPLILSKKKEITPVIIVSSELMKQDENEIKQISAVSLPRRDSNVSHSVIESSTNIEPSIQSHVSIEVKSVKLTEDATSYNSQTSKDNFSRKSTPSRTNGIYNSEGGSFGFFNQERSSSSEQHTALLPETIPEVMQESLGILRDNPYFTRMCYYVNAEKNNSVSLYLAVNTHAVEIKTIQEFLKLEDIKVDYQGSILTAEHAVCCFADQAHILKTLNWLCRLGWFTPNCQGAGLLNFRDLLNPSSAILLLSENEQGISLVDIDKDSARLLIMLPEKNATHFADNAMRFLGVGLDSVTRDELRKDRVHHARSGIHPYWAIIKGKENISNLLMKLKEKNLLNLDMLLDIAPKYLDSDVLAKIKRADHVHFEEINPLPSVIPGSGNFPALDKEIAKIAFDEVKRVRNIELVCILTSKSIQEKMTQKITQAVFISLAKSHHTFVINKFEALVSQSLIKYLELQKQNECDFMDDEEQIELSDTIKQYMRDIKEQLLAECLKNFYLSCGAYWAHSPNKVTFVSSPLRYQKLLAKILDEKAAELTRLFTQKINPSSLDESSNSSTPFNVNDVILSLQDSATVASARSIRARDEQKQLLNSISEVAKRDQRIDWVIKAKKLLPPCYAALSFNELRIYLRSAFIDNINMTDERGVTLLEYAVSASHRNLAHFLISEGANPKCVNFERIEQSRAGDVGSYPITRQELDNMQMRGIYSKKDEKLKAISKKLLEIYPPLLNEKVASKHNSFFGPIKFGYRDEGFDQRCEYIETIIEMINVAKVTHNLNPLYVKLQEMSENLITGPFGTISSNLHGMLKEILKGVKEDIETLMSYEQRLPMQNRSKQVELSCL